MGKREKDLSNIAAGTCRCSVCGIVKPNTEFPYYTNQFYNKGRDNPLTGTRKRTNTNCYDCISKLSKERRAITKKFKNLKPPEYGEPCECCGKPVYASKKDVPEGVDGTWVWQLDHCHKTGKFRGWACKLCNTGMGMCGDTLQELELRVEYLKRAENNENPSQRNYLQG